MSAPKAWNSTLSMTIDRPNVLRSGIRKPPRRLRSRMQACKAQPIAAMPGSTISSPMNGEMSASSASTYSANAARIARLPCARLMIRITPYMNDKPQATSA